jgi:hypothetical protein
MTLSIWASRYAVLHLHQREEEYSAEDCRADRECTIDGRAAGGLRRKGAAANVQHGEADPSGEDKCDDFENSGDSIVYDSAVGRMSRYPMPLTSHTGTYIVRELI